MKQLTKKDKECYLSAFHDVLIWKIGRIQDKGNDPAMCNYQIEVLEKENPVKFAKKIKELKKTRNSILKKWQRDQKKIRVLEEELAVYEKHLKKIKN